MEEETVIIECQKCGREVGQMQEIAGHSWLVVNGIAVNVMRGVCLHCNHEFHWSISEKALATILSRTKNDDL